MNKPYNPAAISAIWSDIYCSGYSANAGFLRTIHEAVGNKPFSVEALLRVAELMRRLAPKAKTRVELVTQFMEANRGIGFGDLTLVRSHGGSQWIVTAADQMHYMSGKPDLIAEQTCDSALLTM